MKKVSEQLAVLPPVKVFEPEYVPQPAKVDTSESLQIELADDGHTWRVDGPWLQRLMGNVNFNDYESRMYFDHTLRESGLFLQLEELGIQDGDTVSMLRFCRSCWGGKFSGSTTCAAPPPAGRSRS